MRRSSSRVSCLVAIAISLHAPLGAAQTATEIDNAKTLYNQGLDLREAGDHIGALTFFRVAFARVRSPIVGLDLAREHVALGELVEGLTIARSIASLPVAAEETDNSAKARSDAAKLAIDLEKRVATIELQVPPNTIIILDGAALTAADAAHRVVNPGKHVLLVTTGALARHDLTLAEGEVKRIVVQAPAPAVVAAPREIAPKRNYTLTYSGLGIAAAGLVAGTITGVLAMSRADDVHDRCGANGPCGTDVSDDIRTVRALGTASTVSFAIAGGGLLLSAFGWVRERERVPITPIVSLGGVGLAGSF